MSATDMYDGAPLAAFPGFHEKVDSSFSTDPIPFADEMKCLFDHQDPETTDDALRLRSWLTVMLARVDAWMAGDAHTIHPELETDRECDDDRETREEAKRAAALRKSGHILIRERRAPSTN